MKKALNATQMINELTGNSSFFKPAPTAQTIYPPSTAYDRTEVTPVRTPSRPTKRHPFEIYEDQLDRLRRLSAQAVLDGQRIGMSEMVREALDTYLKSRL